MTTRAGPIVWAIVGTAVFAIGLCAICAHILIEMHISVREKAVGVAGRVVAAVKNDVLRNIESIDLSLQAVVDGLKPPHIDPLPPQLRHALLFHRSATPPHLRP